MDLFEFDFNYPLEQVAQYPSAQRGDTKLFVAHRKSQEIEHTTFDQISYFLQDGDCMVVNDAKVFPARLWGKKDTGGQVEIFLLRNIKENIWECLCRDSRRIKLSQKIIFGKMLEAKVYDIQGEKTFIEFYYEGDFDALLKQVGHIPLPLYIKRSDESVDHDRYQTIFAEKMGAVAAPTAGLHWTKELLSKIKQKGIEIVPITLHVGLGTFQPIRADDITKHKMHSEYVEISKAAAQKINDARRVVAIGTTTVRALESSVQNEIVESWSGWTDLFIYPEYDFKVVDVLQTNFHQPRSSLFVMVSAFTGREFLLRCYQEAFRQNYQLFSYGDTMVIL